MAYNAYKLYGSVIYMVFIINVKMAVVENMVFNKLEKYREAANREIFILPESTKLDVFVNTIKECINFFHH